MKYNFSFYNKTNLKEIERLILLSYGWEYPAFGLSRLEFSNGLHPDFMRFSNFWERTCGVFSENGKVVAAIINEGNDEASAFFLFDSKERAQDAELLEEMLFHAKTVMCSVEDPKGEQHHSCIMVPEWNTALMALCEKHGYSRGDYSERLFIREIKGKREVKLPEGYTFADATTTPPFYRANVHMAAFNYSIRKVPDSEKGWAKIRNQKHYDPYFDLVILDPQKRPVAMANIWYDEKMPYCELEPLGVAWWERRKGLASAILNEENNRVLEKYPKCSGMTGGDQPFYRAIGFECKTTTYLYHWFGDIIISWDGRSKDCDYSKIL